MAELDYSKIEKDTFNFSYPKADVSINGKSISGSEFSLIELDVELTSGYEASIGTFLLSSVYDEVDRVFATEKFQSLIALGSKVEISFGYDQDGVIVFVGYIAKVNFRLDTENVAGVEVTCLDVKGMMMTGRYSRQLAAKFYGEAVSERIRDKRYAKFITKDIIDDTPDMPPKPAPEGPAEETDITIEMVNESDYEFITKIAKRYNFDFFVVGGNVVFRKAKSDPSILMVITTETGLKSVNVEYDISGLAGKIEVRNTDPNTGKLIKSVKEIDSDKISLESKAKPIVSAAKQVYIDPTIQSQKDADARAEFLVEDISFRLGTAYLTLIGIPRIVPGRYIQLAGFGKGMDNTFYIHSVRHVFDDERGYVTEIIAKTAGMNYQPKTSIPF